MSLLLYLSIAFNVWMFLDAVRRRAPLLWFLVLLTPIGGLIYFVSVKLRDFGIRPSLADQEGRQEGGQALGQKGDREGDREGDQRRGKGRGPKRPRRPPAPPANLVTLRQAVEESPSFKNRTALGWALLEAGDGTGAQEQFMAALHSHPQDHEALLGQGAAALAEANTTAAIDALTRVVERNLRYRDYQAARLLVRALLEAEQADEALALAKQIARHSRRYVHQLELARLYMRLGDLEAARLTTIGLLAEWDREPAQRRERWALVADEARQLLRSLNQTNQPRPDTARR